MFNNKVIAKIEKPQAVENLQEIVDAFDGIMVARGDLGVELPIEDVPMVQKSCITMARESAKPVIVATQMLDSMISNSQPTRAEATDCANAVLDGADALMSIKPRRRLVWLAGQPTRSFRKRRWMMSRSSRFLNSRALVSVSVAHS